MLRQTAPSRTTFADGDETSPASKSPMRQSAATFGARALRLIVAPLALAAAALGGLVFAVLLPICGIATISEGIAKASWRFVREAFGPVPHRPARRI
jgi:hypothetical protein